MSMGSCGTLGFMEEVVFSPRLSVTRQCASVVMPLPMSVRNTAFCIESEQSVQQQVSAITRINSGVGMSSKPMALAE